MFEMSLKNSTQDELIQQVKIIRREGKILERFDKEDETGFKTGLFIEWQGTEWLIMMHNGEVKRLRKIEE